MYCKNCGTEVAENALFCSHCGTRLGTTQMQTVPKDRSNFGFAILGFFIPLAGLILFLVYERRMPKRAKSAGKGALSGFITAIILTILIVALYVGLVASLFSSISSADSRREELSAGNYGNEDKANDMTEEEYVDVSFGEFTISDNGYYTETSLAVTVKNITEQRYTYYITIEAIDANGARIKTDTIFADRLGPGQEISLTAFEYVEEEKIDQLNNATFRIIEISKYDF